MKLEHVFNNFCSLAAAVATPKERHAIDDVELRLVAILNHRKIYYLINMQKIVFFFGVVLLGAHRTGAAVFQDIVE